MEKRKKTVQVQCTFLMMEPHNYLHTVCNLKKGWGWSSLNDVHKKTQLNLKTKESDILDEVESMYYTLETTGLE